LVANCAVAGRNSAETRRGWDWALAHATCLRETRRILRSTCAAEDAAQEALLRAWRQRDQCRGDQMALPWLTAIARNEALRMLAQDTLIDPTGDINSFSDLAGRWDDALPAALDVQHALAELPAPDRRLMLLRYADDLTQKEIAMRLGIPEGTAKVRLHRLRSRLRHLLED